MSWKLFLKNYFNFSRAERFGILGLTVCIVIMLTIKWSTPFRKNPKLPDVKAFADDIEQFRIAVAAKTTTDYQIETSIYDQNIAEFFYFDPNRATDDDFNKLGFNERQILNIRNYQAAGGSFRRKEDLQRLYTVSATQYRQLEPYIRIAGNEQNVRQNAPVASTIPIVEETENITAENPQNNAIRLIELNSADSSLLTQLSGIGPILAARTLRYRNLIGGFIDVAQLSEVYGINDDLVERLSAQLSADSSLIRKISMNTATFNDFVRHPYITEQQARGIINYRRLQNRINNIEELVRNNILERESAEKIRPYMSFE